MLILAIDSSTDLLGLALVEDQKLLGEYSLNLKRQHSEKLIPLIEEIFNILDAKIEDLDAVAVSTGPGSFTGLRIGITAAKILGRIFSIPVKGVSTLEIMAAAVTGEYILPLIDARRKRVYYSLYNNKKDGFGADKTLKELQKASAAEIKKLPKLLAEYKNEKITVIGQKNIEVAKTMRADGFKIEETTLGHNFPRAAVLAELALSAVKSNNSDDIYQLKPAYLKKTQAEIDWQQKDADKS